MDLLSLSRRSGEAPLDGTDPFALRGPQFPSGCKLLQNLEGSRQARSGVISDIGQLDEDDDQITLPIGIAEVEHNQCLTDSEALVERVERLRASIRLCQRGANVLVAIGNIPLPLGTAAINGNESRSDVEALVKDGERVVFAPPRQQKAADIVVADRQIPLPLEIGGIGAAELVTDHETCPIGRQRLPVLSRLDERHA